MSQEPDRNREQAAEVPEVQGPPPRGEAPVAGRRGPAYYYGRGAAAYYHGGGGYGGAYYGPGGDVGADPEQESILGSLTFQRMMRVTLQKWPTLLAAVLLGLGGGFAYYKTAPVVYKSWSTIEMSVRPRRIIVGMDRVEPDLTGFTSAEEVFNTRLAKLRSRAFLELVAERVRAEFPNLGLSDEEMYRMLAENVTMDLVRRSRLVTISARHTRPDVARAIANAYATTAVSFSMDENKSMSEGAVSWLRTTADGQRRQLERADQAALDFRVANQIDVMENEKRAIDSVLQKVNSDLADAESSESKAVELLSALTAIRDNPERAGSLPEIVPRSAEIATAQQKLQSAIADRDVMLLRYTARHPEVVLKDSAVDIARKQFAESVNHARETAAANVDLLRKQTEALRQKKTQNEQLSSDLELRIVSATMKLEQLDREREVSDLSFRGVLRRMEEARLTSDENTATISVVEPAFVPRSPISPMASVAFTTGPGLGLILGVLFILLLDRLEDRITGTSDIEGHMAARVLALVPHVPRAKRDVLAVMTATRKFSRLAEAFAGLRSLMESPRYQEMSRVVLVVSTQPEEGKTITCCNVSLAYALTGQRTLLVDFDMRRPRLAHVFGLRSTNPPSLMHVLNENDPSLFGTLPVSSGYPSLDIVTSRSTTQISPASIMGSGIVPQFIKWARENYERVIIDSPPFGLVSDSVVLATLADSVVMVCRPDLSRYRAMRHAIRYLSSAGATVMGVVVNDVDFGRSSYFSNYDYHTYGYSYTYKYGKYGRYYTRLAEDRETPSTPSGAAAPTPDEAAAAASARPTESVLDVDDDE